MRLSQKMARSGKRKKPPPLESRRGGWQYERRRVRKKQKRLDAICDKAYTVAKSNEAANVAGSAPGTAEPDPAHFRRSSRLRKTPVVFDASPSPSKRNPKIGSSNKKVDTGSANRRKGKGLFVKSSPSRDFRDSKDKENWGSRLRARVKNDGVGTFKGMSSRAGAKRKLFGDSELDDRGDRDDRDDGFEDMVSPVAKSKRICKAEGSTDEKSRDPITGSCSREEENNERTLRDWISDSNVEAMSPPKSAGNSGNERVDFDNSELVIEKEDDKTTAGLSLDDGPNGNKDLETTEERDKVPEQPYADDLRTRTLADENVVNVENLNPVSNDTLEKPPRIREGRRCGLCGGGTDGRPPKRLVLDAGESDSEAYGGSSASEDPNYDVWDGFGDEPSWLGRLLGPINDRFGIAGVWVHQQCAVWSPEVYFAGLGCLKNVRRALCRGRALKCSRCGRPGATVGCRVDRCPKTYHLPCGRADGCIFDHRKFLIACTDHRHLFQLQGDHYLRRIKKMKAKKMRLDMRKGSNDAWWNDCEAEEKWLENCGEDEEFLKREGKRLHRDISRIAPVYIGGSFSESEKLYQGWESVAGLQHVIRCMKEVVILPLLYPEFFSTMGLTPPRGVLLHGYPGTGKTLVVRALIGACSRGDKRIAYFARKGADCLGKYVGDAERQLRLLFQVAERSQPSIIFFDEIDGLAPRRSRQQDQTHSSVVSTLLALLDGLKSRGSVIVIGATNRPEAVDPALRRPGRFDREIYFPLPSVKDRSAILSLHTQRWPKPVSGSLLKWVATQTVGFAGADLQALCTQAAMIALKRNFPLQELLSAAEKFPNHSRCLSLPSFAVEERDWLAALACAPPPCSRREAGMAANDVVSSPLHAHLIPCLLQPLSLLLISLYHDERIRLPPALYNAAMIIKGVIISALERKKAPIVFWLSHFHNMIEEPDVMKEIERNLSDSGFINDTCAFPNSGPLEDDNDYDCGKFELFKLIPGGARVSSSLMQNLSYSWGKTSGFRVLIAGNPRSGQRHVATCLLHGFKGHIEIQKVDLATISQEGRGDIVSGITRILLKCLSVGQCIIYMPRIDLWALDETNLQSTRKENNFCPKTSKSALTEGLHDAIVTSSEAWNSFIEQVDSMCISTSFMILATCEMPKHALPLRMRQFFTSDLLNCTVSAPSEHTIPRFCLQIDGNFNHEMVIDLSAAKLSRDLVQQYVQLMHQRTHVHDAFKEFKICDTMQVHKEVENHKTDNGAINEVMPMPVDSERIASNGGTSCIDVQMQQCINDDKQRSPLFKTNCQRKDEVQVQSHQDSVSRIPPNRIAKGKSNLLLTIATFGYQILRYPHFAELCWATSKLKEGPCTGVDGPRKGWPFNSCVIRAMSSLEKGAVGCSSIDIKNREHSGVVRGLIAVGLMAYKGVYTSIREVSVEVRKVLELLVGQINAKILGGKDRYRFLRLLSQVAYLEDMVNTWAYTLRSLEVDNQISMSSTRSAIVGGMDNHACGSGLAENDACMPSDHNNSRRDANFQEQSPLTVVTENGECVASYGVTHLPNSGTSIMISDGEPCQEMLSPKTSIPDLRRTSGVTAGSLATENASNEMHKTNHVISESPVPPAELKRLGFLKHSNGLMGTEVVFPNGDDVHDLGQSAVIINSSSKKVYDRCNGIADNVLSSKDGGYNHDVPGAVSISTFKESSNLPAVSETSCLYDCCSECLHAVNVLIREILVDRWESNGCCSTVEDVHNVVSSCSASLLAAIRKSYVAESSMDSEVFCGGPGRKPKDGAHNEGCACRAVVDNKVKKETSWSKCSGKKQVMPMECSCHLRSKEATATTNSLRSSQIGLKKIFRDSTLVDTDPDKDVLFHCKFETLCMCSLIERILMVKQPID